MNATRTLSIENAIAYVKAYHAVAARGREDVTIASANLENNMIEIVATLGDETTLHWSVWPTMMLTPCALCGWRPATFARKSTMRDVLEAVVIGLVISALGVWIIILASPV